MIRICLLNPVGVIGGAERVLLASAEAAQLAWPSARLSAILLADGPLRQRLTDLGVAVDVVSLPTEIAQVGDTGAKGRGGWLGLVQKLAASSWKLRSFVEQLRVTICRHSPTLLHSHGLKTHLLLAWARPRGIPVLWHLHDFYSERPVARWCVKLARRGVRAAIAISDAVHRDFSSVLPGIPVRTILNTVKTDQFSPVGEHADLDRQAGLSPATPNSVRIGLVATFANWKGHHLFLDALARIPSELNWRAYIVGGPIYATTGSQVTRHELEQRAAGLGLQGRVGFVPFQAHPASVYRALDIVVHASTRPEPFGLTIAEGMSCGRAVVVSAGGGAKELFRDGEDALGFSPGDVSGLAARLTSLVTNSSLRMQLGSAARISALHHFSPDRLPAQVRAVYSTVCSQLRQGWSEMEFDKNFNDQQHPEREAKP